MPLAPAPCGREEKSVRLAPVNRPPPVPTGIGYAGVSAAVLALPHRFKMVSKPTRSFSPSRPKVFEAPALSILLQVRWYWYELAKFCSSAGSCALVLSVGVISPQPGI